MQKSILSFKSNFPNLTVLKIHSQDIAQLEENVRKKIRQAPMMFIGMQIVIDLSDFDNEESLTLPLNKFKKFLLGESINPIAIMSNNLEAQKLAIELDLGALRTLNANSTRNTNHSNDVLEKNEVTEAPSSESSDQIIIDPATDEPRKTFDEVANTDIKSSENLETNSAEIVNQNKTIQHSIRSGQSIYSKGDLTIIGSVSHGAEIIADGNIHIYGTLRGRAIAGAHGDTKACIFCQNLDAELIAIAGSYTQIEDTKKNYLGKTVQISLEKEKICFFPL